MGARENKDSTNLPLVKVGRSGTVIVASEKDKKDEDADAFKRLMAKLQEEARPQGYLHGKGALDHDDVLYLKEQRQAEEDAERMRDHSEKRAFAAYRAAVDAAGSQSQPLRVEPRPKSGIRQHDLLRGMVEIKPKRQKLLGKSTTNITDKEASPQGKTLLGLSYSDSEDDEPTKLDFK